MTFLISDARLTVDGPDHFSLYGDEIRLVEGRLINAEGVLAGAHLTMADAVARLIHRLGQPPATALRMATTIPARVIGRAEGLIGQRVEDLLILGKAFAVTSVGVTMPQVA